MTVLELLERKRNEILEIAARHGARNVRIFGSAARGDAIATSDIDFLVDTTDNPSPWFPAGLIEDLETLLDRKVDVMTEGGFSWLLRRRIVKEAKPL